MRRKRLCVVVGVGVGIGGSIARKFARGFIFSLYFTMVIFINIYIMFGESCMLLELHSWCAQGYIFSLYFRMCIFILHIFKVENGSIKYLCNVWGELYALSLCKR